MWRKVKNKFLKKSEPSFDYIFVGLGNPGEKYKKTAHNSGFRVVSFIKEESSLPSFIKDNTLNSLVSKGEIDDKKILLMLPLTFMNLSGEAVKKAIKRFSISVETLVVIHDDTDLPFGSVRFSKNKSSAGHKGVVSIIKSIRTQNFIRVRVGVSKKNIKAREIVLKNLPTTAIDVEKKVALEIIKCLTEGFSPKTLKLNEETKNTL